MGSGVPRQANVAKTTTVDAAEPFVLSPMWVVDGLFDVATNALSLGQTPDPAFSSFPADSKFGVRYVALHKMLIKPTTGGSHGTLTFFGIVVDDLDAFLRRYGAI